MKTLKQAAYEYAIDNSFIGKETIIYNAFIAGAEFVNRWIDVDNEMPNDRDIVLIHVNNLFKTVGCFNYTNHRWYFYDFSDNEFYELSKNDIVLFWKPINLE